MEYKLRQHIQCKAKKIVSFGVFMYCPNGQDMLCHISNISDGFVSDISKFVKIGEIYDAEVILDKTGKQTLSLKHLHLSDNSDNESSESKEVRIERSRKNITHQSNDDNSISDFDRMIDNWKKDYKSNIGLGDPKQLGQKSKRKKKGNRR